MAQPAARIGDVGDHGGAITSGSSSVICEGVPLSGVGDAMTCPKHGPGVLDKSSTSVFVCGKGVVRVSDLCDCGSAGKAGEGVPGTISPDTVQVDDASGEPAAVDPIARDLQDAEKLQNDPDAYFQERYGTQTATKEWADGVSSELKVTPHGSGTEVTGATVEGHLLGGKIEGGATDSVLGSGTKTTVSGEVKLGKFEVEFDPDSNRYGFKGALADGSVSSTTTDGLGNVFEAKASGTLYQAKGYVHGGGGSLGAGAQYTPFGGKVSVSVERRLFDAQRVHVDAPDQLAGLRAAEAGGTRVSLLEKVITYGHQGTAKVLGFFGYFDEVQGDGILPIDEKTGRAVLEAVGVSPEAASSFVRKTVGVDAFASVSGGAKKGATTWDIFYGGEDGVGVEGVKRAKDPAKWGIRFSVGEAPSNRSTEDGAAGKQGVVKGASQTFVGG